MLLIAAAVCWQAQAQLRTVSGVVTDAEGETVIGASVVVKGNDKYGAVTNIDGEYSIQVPAKSATLVFSYVGYKPVEINLAPGQTTANVQLAENTEMLEDVIVVGYGSMKRKDLTGSVSHGEQPPTPSTSSSAVFLA